MIVAAQKIFLQFDLHWCYLVKNTYGNDFNFKKITCYWVNITQQAYYGKLNNKSCQNSKRCQRVFLLVWEHCMVLENKIYPVKRQPTVKQETQVFRQMSSAFQDSQ